MFILLHAAKKFVFSAYFRKRSKINSSKTRGQDFDNLSHRTIVSFLWKLMPLFTWQLCRPLFIIHNLWIILMDHKLWISTITNTWKILVQKKRVSTEFVVTNIMLSKSSIFLLSLTVKVIFDIFYRLLCDS